MRFKGKNIIVTGGARGIGRATLEWFARGGDIDQPRATASGHTG